MRISRISSAAAIVALLVLAPATAASAHDELVSSSPAAGEQLSTAPESITLAFSAEVLTMGAAIMVVDADGTDWVASEPVVDYGEVTATLESGMPDAGYEVRWRVVSSDGHPISGVIPFTVGDAEPLVAESAAPAQSQAAEPGAAEPGAAEPGNPEEEEQGTTAEGGVPRALLVGGATAIMAGAVFALVSVIRRRARRADTETTDA
ncbi:copper resistance protein CopC [Microbacterium mitrae]|uniref:Copper resistance protein CopC n=1 Tax=Microbacterium mitrae TaxID=664640 RepID=A0A5C8HLD8_9MICO|nr:copper resistance CopC family protein [Microbacterium mitrae]TXK04084.1 copper resistance protein CopC [Microbacterium mitrae]